MGDIVSLDAARERLAERRSQNPILEALDALAVALAEHGHTWTDRERALYETSVEYLTGGSA